MVTASHGPGTFFPQHEWQGIVCGCAGETAGKGGLCVDVGHACLNGGNVHVAEVVCVSACIPHLWGGGVVEGLDKQL